MNERNFGDFDYDRVRCPYCGSEFDVKEMDVHGRCPECGEYVNQPGER